MPSISVKFIGNVLHIGLHNWINRLSWQLAVYSYGTLSQSLTHSPHIVSYFMEESADHFDSSITLVPVSSSSYLIFKPFRMNELVHCSSGWETVWHRLYNRPYFILFNIYAKRQQSKDRIFLLKYATHHISYRFLQMDEEWAKVKRYFSF